MTAVLLPEKSISSSFDWTLNTPSMISAIEIGSAPLAGLSFVHGTFIALGIVPLSTQSRGTRVDQHDGLVAVAHALRVLDDLRLPDGLDSRGQPRRLNAERGAFPRGLRECGVHGVLRVLVAHDGDLLTAVHDVHGPQTRRDLYRHVVPRPREPQESPRLLLRTVPLSCASSSPLFSVSNARDPFQDHPGPDHLAHSQSGSSSSSSSSFSSRSSSFSSRSPSPGWSVAC